MADAASKTTGPRRAVGTIKDSNVYNLAGRKLESLGDTRVSRNGGCAMKAKSFLDMGEGPIRYSGILPKFDGTKGG